MEKQDRVTIYIECVFKGNIIVSALRIRGSEIALEKNKQNTIITFLKNKSAFD